MIFVSEFSATFNKTVMGKVWGFVMPVVPLLAFFLLTALRVFPSHETIDPLSYMAVGVTLWLFFHGLIMVPTEAVAKRAPVLKSSNFPMICLFMASYGRLAFEMLVRIAVIAPILLMSGVSAEGLLLVPLLLVPASAFCVALGILLGLGGVLLQDLKNIAEIILRYLIFVSFAIFPLSLGGLGEWLYVLNPLAIFIDNIRNVLILGELAKPEHFFVVTVFSAVLLVFVLHLYSVLERRIAGAL
jgi:ABC-type polysaccharide/polyol phosphate export permease